MTNLRQSKGGGTFTAPLAGSDFVDEYLVNVTVGNQEFALIVDTGSSDTWVPEVGFQCIDLNNNPQPESVCAFGTAGYSSKKSPTFELDPNRNFNITYGDGEFLTGPVGFETITIGGMAVKKQEFGTVTVAAWEGDGVNTGLTGLAFPDLTSVYQGDNPDADEFPQTQLVYNSIFFTAVQEGLVKNPFFSIALDRGTFNQQLNVPFVPNLGFISFGGIAPVPVTDTSTTVPVQGYDVTTFDPSNAPTATKFFYTVDVQGYIFPGSEALLTKNNDTILDSGTTLNILPDDVAAAYAAAFVPPAVFNADFGLYEVVCSAKVPPFEVVLGGEKFSIAGPDQLLPLGETDAAGNQLCITGTAPGGPAVDGNIFILGDVFLHNVVATFNIKANEITVTQRKPY